MEVLVFRTSVDSIENVAKLRAQLDSFAGRGSWNFALDDCDRILRVKADRKDLPAAVNILQRNGFLCYELED